ncbi:MAG: hypothetical protein HOK63_03250 [Thaumarchaeota archaeon]|jgi:hypothetical protein|nr:hypothetical protein [Nitrososphaerota archaeon]MBT5843328.1 hypothetical protein [Nitrososphaerota archaeon]MBT6468654.1 hypothetical protein [Nitrososphaerota archaeon]
MNKIIIIGIIVFAAIGIGFAVMQADEDDNDDGVIVETDNDGPKKYTVSISESMGVTGAP